MVPRLIRIWRIHWWCVHFFCFGMGTYFLGKFSPQNHNCQFKLKFVTWTNSNMLSSIMLFICFTLETPFFGQIWSKKSNMLVWAESWYLDLFRYAKFIGAVHFFYFRLEAPFLGKFGSKNTNCQYKVCVRYFLSIFFFSSNDRPSRFKRANGSGIIYDVIIWLA